MRSAIEVIQDATGPYQCPFCKGTFSVSNPTELSSSAAILHSIPTCKEYDAIDSVDDAIRYMRATHN